MNRRVEVEWRDSQVHLGGWAPVTEHGKRRRNTTCFSIGYLLADDKRGVMLAGSLNGTNAAGVISIPASQIVRRRKLRP